jgi:aminoglycoside phosphotransferase
MKTNQREKRNQKARSKLTRKQKLQHFLRRRKLAVPGVPALNALHQEESLSISSIFGTACR